MNQDLRLDKWSIWLLAAIFFALVGGADCAAAAGARGDVATEISRAKNAMVASPRVALAIAEQAEISSAALEDPRERAINIATALWLQSEAKLRTGASVGVETALSRALTIIEPFREPMKLRGDLLLTRGGLEVEQSKPAEALGSFQEAFRTFQQAREARGQALALQNIALLYTHAEDNERAIRYYQAASEVYGGDPNIVLFARINRGVLLLQMERYSQSITELKAALDLAKKVGSPALQVSAAANLARSYLGARRWTAAAAAIAEGRRILDGSEPRKVRLKLDTVEAQLELKQSNSTAAVELIDAIFDGVDLESTPLSLRDAHFTAYTAYKATGNTALALQHLAAERRLSEEASKVAISTSAALMAARFDFANQELRIANLKAEELRRNIAFERAQVRTERLIYGGLAVALVTLLGLLSFGLFTIRRSRNEVRDANIVLADTNVALEKALRAKTEFLATTSHEIRTPLNGILGMTQVMLADTRIGGAVRDRIGVVHGAGLTMRSLVDDILDVAKMETGNLTVEMAAMDLPATLRDVCRIWEEQARGKGIGFTLDVADAPRWIECDPGRLRQIVFNLLSNAIKFTAAGEVAVTAACRGDALTIAVRDSGIGIPADRQADIFESFQQVDAGTTRQFGGTGLGLTICRNLAVALGGDIAVTSAAGQGSTFVVTIPYRAADAPDSPASADRDCGLVVLDRNPIARSMLKAVLEPRCGSVRFVASQDELLAAIEEESVDRMLIDEATLKALEGDPIARLGEIAALADRAGIATSVLWAQPDAATRDALSAAGIGQIIAKPIAGVALAELLAPQPVAFPKDPLVSQAA